jgi:hypothetical protein
MDLNKINNPLFYRLFWKFNYKIQKKKLKLDIIFESMGNS